MVLARLENEVEQRRHEINLESVGETREKGERDEISNDQRKEERESRKLPKRGRGGGGFVRAETEELEIFARDKGES